MTSAIIDGARVASHQRKILRCRAALHFGGGVMVAVRTTDISSTGMSVLSGHSLARGIACRVVFQLPVNGRLYDTDVGAQVLYNTCQGTEGFRLGLRFTDLDPARSKLINSLY